MSELMRMAAMVLVVGAGLFGLWILRDTKREKQE
jgi:prephenate dehydrogenase